MAKNITLQGADYTDVPAVKLPKTGGGTAMFVDVSDTTATTGDVVSSAYFYNANGQRVAGTLNTITGVSVSLGYGNMEYQIPPGHYTGGNVVSVNGVAGPNIVPSYQSQYFFPDAGKVFTSISVDPIPTPTPQTQTVSVSLTTGSSSVADRTVTFDSLGEVKGITALSVSGASTSTAAMIRFEYAYWNNAVFGIGRATNSQTSSTFSITGYYGTIDPTRVESKEVTMNGATVVAEFDNTIKCIKCILDGNRSYRRIVGISISGKRITFTTVGSTNHTQTVEIYY